MWTNLKMGPKIKNLNTWLESAYQRTSIIPFFYEIKQSLILDPLDFMWTNLKRGPNSKNLVQFDSAYLRTPRIQEYNPIEICQEISNLYKENYCIWPLIPLQFGT